MQISKRDFLRKLGLGGAALATGAVFGELAKSLDAQNVYRAFRG